jgi:hypothetical protein
MASEKDTSLEFVYHMLTEIRDEQKRISSELINHAKDDAIHSKEIAAHLTTIKVQLATLDTKVKHHTGYFNKAWAIIIPTIISLISLSLTGTI